MLVSIQWQQLVAGSCTPVGISNCANTSPRMYMEYGWNRSKF